MLQIDGLFVFLMLVLGHVLGDFFLQPDHWVKDKNTNKSRSLCLYYHASIHGLLVALIVGFATKQNLFSTITIALVLALAHGIIDYIKIKIGKKGKWFVIDQLLHIATLILLWFFLYATAFEQTSTLLKTLDYNESLLVIIAYVIMLKPSAVLMGIMLSKWSIEISTSKNTTHDNENETGALSNAGQYLGYIERILVLTFVLNNQFAAVGFVLAAKSIFRMGDLREAHDRKFTEYVMLGTLFSMSLALFTGIAVENLLS